MSCVPLMGGVLRELAEGKVHLVSLLFCFVLFLRCFFASRL